MSNTYSAGVVTAYGAAVRGGYTGTYAEWCAAMADFGDKSQQAIDAADQAAQSATDAAGSATDAADSASAAATSEDNAADSASAAAASETNAASSASAAAQSATGAADSASAAAGSSANAAASAAAAQAVKESIPADYTALSDNVKDIESIAGAIKYTIFESGTITTGNVDDVIDVNTVTPNNAWLHLLLPCTGGEKFEIYGDGGVASRLFCVTDESGKVLRVAGNNMHRVFTIIAPNNAAYLVFNTRATETNAYIIRGETAHNFSRKSASINLNANAVGMWESGGIQSTTGANVANTKRCRTKTFIDRNIAYIDTTDEYRVTVYVYGLSGEYIGIATGDGTYTQSATWVKRFDLSSIPLYYKVRLCLAYAPEYINVDIGITESINVDLFINTRHFYDINTAEFWSVGGIQSITGTDAANTKRLRSKALDAYTIEKIVYNPNVYRCVVYVYSDGIYEGTLQADGTIAKTSGAWITTGEINIALLFAGKQIRLLFARIDNLDFTEIDKNAFAIISYLSSNANIGGIPIDGKGVKDAAILAAIGQYSNVKAISHRGTRLTRPDSTSIAYINAKACGFAYAEGDLQRTSDGYYVIGHDNNILDRTGLDLNISDLTLAELKQIDFGGYLFPAYAGQAILTLQEFLNLCDKLNMTPVLDFKSKTQEQVAEIMNILKSYGAEIYNINGTLETLKYVLAINPDQFVRRSYEAYSQTVENEINSLFADFPNAEFMVAYYIASATWTDAILENIVNRGIKVAPYEINNSVQYNNMCLGRYYIHNMMCGGDFNPVEYAMTRDNNLIINNN